MQEIVSVIMLAYNHENWIARAIEGVLNQKTDFQFRLYINDDCSTDNTRTIIQKFKDRNPEKVTLILQSENQWSKGKHVISDILIPKTMGKYIAICEGDDYWIDEYKLQKQYDYMRRNPKCSIIFSNAKVIDFDGNELTTFLPQDVWNNINIKNKILSKEANFNVEEMILLDFIPTASIMTKRTAYEKMQPLKNELDLMIRLVATSLGYAHYCNECMVAYRTGNPNSASGVIKKSKQKLKENFLDLHHNILNEFDDFSDNRYSFM